MKNLHWLYIGASLLLCLCLLAPVTTLAASSKNARDKSQKTLVKQKTAKKMASVSKKSSSKKSSSKTRSAKKSGSSMAAATSGKKNPEREIWLKRARESEVLSGKASWYGRDFHNKATASGIKYNMHTFTAAHRTLPMGTVVKVTDQHNGKSVMVCVTDRGPFVRGRIIDVSYAAAKQLGLKDKGVGKVKLEVVGDETGAPLRKDHAWFVKYAADHGKNKVGPFSGFADAAAMHEALMQAHPEAEVILEKTRP